MTILGIDLGTTNSLVATLVNGKPETLANELGEHLTPSAVAIAEDGGLLVGRPAWDRLVAAPKSGRAFFKRDMGTAMKYTFGGRTWLPIECSALVLGEMRRIAQLHLGSKVREAVITVPAYFHESQRQATIEAAHLAGLAVARIVNEPTAAALAYGLGDPGRDQRQLVFDLGGGTFDVTVLEQFAGVVEVRASGGDGRLGGEDYTDLLLDLLLRRCGLDREAPDLGAKRAKVESVKRRLSAQDRVGLVLAGNELVVTRGDFEQATLELTARLRPIVHRCLRDAKIAANELDAVLLVGGATRMHMIQDFVRNEFGKAGIAVLDPDRVVALGAAVQAGLAAGDAAVQDLVLTDVSAHTLGIETTKQLAPGHKLSGYFTPIIERNTTVPVSRAKRFETLTSEQDEILLRIYQGEGRQTKDNQLLGNLTISGLRRPHPETASIEVRFSYDMSGLLEVDVLVLHSGVKFHTVIEERPGSLNSSQMEEIRARLAPLKFLARERLQNRARLERANRVYTQLLGEPRAILDHLVTQFEALLETAPEEIWEACGKQLDEFLAQFPLEEGHWQPPTGDAGPSS